MDDSLVEKEFARQMKNLVDIDSMLELETWINKNKSSLIEKLQRSLRGVGEISATHIPFVVVVKSDLLPVERVMSRVVAKGQAGEVRMTPHVPSDFSPIEGLDIPEDSIYLLLDIDTGRETLAITPHEALKMITRQKRTPLTIDEGVSLVLQFPEVLIEKEK